MGARRFPLALAALLTVPALAQGADLSGTWVLTGAKLTYIGSHPLHHFEGVSTAARGKGTADSKGGRFLIAVPVKSFNSGDSNRDLHMLEVTRAGTYPMVTVRVDMIGDARTGLPDKTRLDAVVTFGGSTTTYRDVFLSVTGDPNGTMHVTGILPCRLTDFNMKAPSLLAMPMKNEIPVKLDLYWKRL